MGVLARRGEMRAAVIPTRHKGDVQAHVREHVGPRSELFTDALKSYDGLEEFQHQVIDHAESLLTDKRTPTAARTSGAC
jgi:hypothetical protein